MKDAGPPSILLDRWGCLISPYTKLFPIYFDSSVKSKKLNVKGLYVV